MQPPLWAAAAPKPLLPGYNRLVCCFNKRGRFWGVRRSDREEKGGEKEKRERGGRERERKRDSSKLIQTPEVVTHGQRKSLTLAGHAPIH